MRKRAQALFPPRVSVIIPTYNDSERCVRCLRALAEQEFPRSEFEILVVDNGSDPQLRLPSNLPEDLQVTLVVELSPGSYAARNRGIREARGDILASTDSDCLPSRTWLSTAFAVLNEKAHDVVLAGIFRSSRRWQKDRPHLNFMTCISVFGRPVLFTSMGLAPRPILLYQSRF